MAITYNRFPVFRSDGSLVGWLTEKNGIPIRFVPLMDEGPELVESPIPGVLGNSLHFLNNLPSTDTKCYWIYPEEA